MENDLKVMGDFFVDKMKLDSKLRKIEVSAYLSEDVLSDLVYEHLKQSFKILMLSSGRITKDDKVSDDILSEYCQLTETEKNLIKCFNTVIRYYSNPSQRKDWNGYLESIKPALGDVI
jgi:hypothetical protein